MADREKVIKGLEHCSNKSFCNDGCPYSSILRDPNLGIDECMTCLAHDALKLLKEQENHVSVPFTWLVKFCTHIDFREPMSDEERAERWKEKLNQQFGVKFDGMKVKWDS